MKGSAILFALCLSSGSCYSQLDIQCQGRDLHSVYLISMQNDMIYRVDSVDTNPTGPIPVQTVPPTTIGISINPILDSIGSPTTMYYVDDLYMYYYWDGFGWVNTFHNSGLPDHVNPGGTSDYIFNVHAVGNAVTRYDGTGNGVVVANIPYSISADLATDSLGNFYIHYYTSKKIVAYTSNGIPIDSINIRGNNVSGGGGFGLLGNSFYLDYNSKLYKGDIVNDSVQFSIVITHPFVANDLAVCPTSGFPVATFEHPELPHLAIFPNPTDEKASIRLNNTTWLEIFDNKGTLLKQADVSGQSEFEVDVSQWSPGIYFISAESKMGTRAALKFVVF